MPILHLRLSRNYPLRGDSREAEVELRARPHYLNEPGMTAYDVLEGGEVRGYIERAVESTDRHSGRIRVPGKGRLAWAWYRAEDGKRNSPGTYEHNRAYAVARVLGWDRGVIEKGEGHA